MIDLAAALGIVVDALESSGVEYLLVESTAAAAWGVVRATRDIDLVAMVSPEGVEDVWSRILHPMLVAQDLSELAERIARRAISTLEIITDDEFEMGLSALREAASSAPGEAVYSPHELLVFTR